MRQYAFPSGVEIMDAPNVAGGVTSLNLAMMALCVGSLCLVIWWLRRPVTWWSIPVSIGVLIAEFVLVRSFSRIQQEPDFFFILSFLFTVLISIGTIAVTLTRKVKKPGFTVGAIFFLTALFGIIFLLPAVQQAREAGRRMVCRNNLKQIGLAVGNYYDIGKYFAPAGLSESNGFVQSWRVTLTQYLDHAPWNELYHFDEPWDSSFNAKVPYNIRMYAYQCPTHLVEKQFTAYSMLTGEGTFGGNGLNKLAKDDVTDGLANTIMIVEACGREIIWTEPRDVEVTNVSMGINLPGDRPGHSRGVISSYHNGGAFVLLADGTSQKRPTRAFSKP